MITSLMINPRLSANAIKEVKYTIDPYDKAQGPVRAMQKFTVILLTTQGTDELHPWFGTELPAITRMNMSNKEEIKLFVKDQVSSAISQFFRLQAGEAKQNNQTIFDVITDIELVGIRVNQFNRLAIDIRFTPAKRESVIYSLEV